MMVKETLNFPKMVEVCEAFENYSEELIGWILIALQDRGMGFRYTAFSSTSGARPGY